MPLPYLLSPLSLFFFLHLPSFLLPQILPLSLPYPVLIFYLLSLFFRFPFLLPVCLSGWLSLYFINLNPLSKFSSFSDSLFVQLNQLSEDPLKRPVVYVKGADAVKLMNIVNKQKVARARIQHRPPRVRTYNHHHRRFIKIILSDEEYLSELVF